MSLRKHRSFAASLWPLLLLASLTAGCETVDFHEMEAFTDPAMEMADGPACIHFQQKVLYSMEGSAGGVGTSAGGGCGCY